MNKYKLTGNALKRQMLRAFLHKNVFMHDRVGWRISNWEHRAVKRTLKHFTYEQYRDAWQAMWTIRV